MIPAEMVVAPVYVFAPERTSVPVPDLVIPNAVPEITELMLIVPVMLILP